MHLYVCMFPDTENMCDGKQELADFLYKGPDGKYVRLCSQEAVYSAFLA